MTDRELSELELEAISAGICKKKAEAKEEEGGEEEKEECAAPAPTCATC